MCSGTCKSPRGMVKLNPQGTTLLPQKSIFTAIDSTDSGAGSRPRVLSLHALFTPHSPTFNHPNERKELCLLHYEAIP